MDKESLFKAREIIIDALDKANINKVDKTELMINLWLLLDESEYDNSIKILQKNINNRRK